MFFIIPGLIILSFAFLLPFFREEHRTLKVSLLNAKEFYKNNYLSIYADWNYVHSAYFECSM